MKPSKPPINMTAINGKVACAKWGGPTFEDTVRVNAFEYNNCPEGYEPCSPATTASDTVCWPKNMDKSNCPILDIFLVSGKENIETFQEQGFLFADGDLEINGFDTKIAYSKIITRFPFSSMEPIMSITLNTFLPCFGYESERLILSGPFTDDMADFTLEKEMPISACWPHKWRQTNLSG